MAVAFLVHIQNLMDLSYSFLKNRKVRERLKDMDRVFVKVMDLRIIFERYLSNAGFGDTKGYTIEEYIRNWCWNPYYCKVEAYKKIEAYNESLDKKKVRLMYQS